VVVQARSGSAFSIGLSRGPTRSGGNERQAIGAISATLRAIVFGEPAVSPL
jgi:hypothetical protein